MNDRLLDAAPWAFLSAACLLFVGVLVLAYQKKTAAAWVVLAGAAVSGGFLYIDHLSEFSASAQGLVIKVQQASDALVGLRKLAALTGGAVINLDANAGRIGGDSAAHRDQLKQQVLATLRTIGLDKVTLESVGSQSRDRDIHDYVWGISRYVEACVLPQSNSAVLKDWRDEFNPLAASDRPDPDAIQKVLEKYHAADGLTAKVLDQYRSFLVSGNPSDTELWKDRE